MSMLLGAFVKEPKSACFYGEEDNEHIVLMLRRSLVTNFRWVVLGILALLTPSIFAGILAFFGDTTADHVPFNLKFIGLSLWTMAWLTFLFVNFLNWFFNVHIVTDVRIVDMDFSGFLHRNITEAPLRTVQDVTHTVSGFMQVVFNFGNVIIQTAGESQEIDFVNVPKPEQAADIISDMVAQLNKEGGLN